MRCVPKRVACAAVETLAAKSLLLCMASLTSSQTASSSRGGRTIHHFLHSPGLKSSVRLSECTRIHARVQFSDGGVSRSRLIRRGLMGYGSTPIQRSATPVSQLASPSDQLVSCARSRCRDRRRADLKGSARTLADTDG